MTASELDRWLGSTLTERMPVLFLGHGSPMNAIEDNLFTRGIHSKGAELPKPRAILCISAHWETYGTQFTAMVQPRTIHDFGGFPEPLYQVQYPAPGMPALASAGAELTLGALDHEHWGLDHGAWSVLLHLVPNADVPVVQMSLDRGKTPTEHVALAKSLTALRRRGVLIVGSGNMVHNLRRVAWDRLNQVGFAYDWATEAHAVLMERVRGQRLDELAQYARLGSAVQFAIPTPEHYLPMLYALSLREPDEALEVFNDYALAGSLTMTSLALGA
jgi:4,5-DOPA dioxygenase extradiol